MVVLLQLSSNTKCLEKGSNSIFYASKSVEQFLLYNWGTAQIINIDTFMIECSFIFITYLLT